MRRLVFLVGLALASPSALAAPEACPPSVEQVLASPALLREQADAALAKDSPELAYRYLALIEELHPESPQSRELFPAAAKLFKRNYFRNRVGKPDSVWTTAEPAFMFHWLSEFFRDAKEFPQEQVDLLFLGMPVTLHDEFLVYAKARPRYFSRWKTRVTDDNGRIESVIASPAP
jgi:hypothetical protein